VSDHGHIEWGAAPKNPQWRVLPTKPRHKKQYRTHPDTYHIEEAGGSATMLGSEPENKRGERRWRLHGPKVDRKPPEVLETRRFKSEAMVRQRLRELLQPKGAPPPAPVPAPKTPPPLPSDRPVGEFRRNLTVPLSQAALDRFFAFEGKYAAAAGGMDKLREAVLFRGLQAMEQELTAIWTSALEDANA
jgi:hypothetical protein